MTILTLHPQGREPLFWTLTAPEDGATFEVTIDEGETWSTLDVTDDVASILAAGPDATDNPDGTMVAARGLQQVWVRMSVTPTWAVIRDGGQLRV
jgi:hypothetical protein